jgi:hypothetical protein
VTGFLYRPIRRFCEGPPCLQMHFGSSSSRALHWPLSGSWCKWCFRSPQRLRRGRPRHQHRDDGGAELRQPIGALSLGGLRKRIEIALLSDDVVLQLDGLAERERHRRRATMGVTAPASRSAF